MRTTLVFSRCVLSQQLPSSWKRAETFCLLFLRQKKKVVHQPERLVQEKGFVLFFSGFPIKLRDAGEKRGESRVESGVENQPRDSFSQRGAD